MSGEAPQRVLLVGFMASGKSSVGRELATLLGWEFLDFDAVVESRAATSVAEIFRDHGEREFRRLESQVAGELLARSRVVLASGGGWPAQADSWERVPPDTLSVWLRVSPGVAVQRASSEGPLRPLLDAEDPLERASELLREREAAYRKAEFELDSEADDPATLAHEIMQLVRLETERHTTDR